MAAADVEDLLQSEGINRGFDVAVLRLGFLYAAEAEHTRYFGRSLLDRDLPIAGGGLLGRRDAQFSLLHADDGGRALATVVEQGGSGLWHVVDDERVTVATFLETLANLLDASAPWRVPGWLVRLLADRQTAQFMTTSMPTTSSKFKRDFEWEPAVPTYRKGLKQVVETWRDEGVLQEGTDCYEWAGFRVKNEDPAATSTQSSRPA